jgi:hypothetical protein
MHTHTHTNTQTHAHALYGIQSLVTVLPMEQALATIHSMYQAGIKQQSVL